MAADSEPVRRVSSTTRSGRTRLPELPRPASLATLLRRLEFPLRAPDTPAGVEPLPPKRKLGADYETEWARRMPARLARMGILEGLMRPTASLFANPDLRGLDRLTDLDGPAVFAANHHSHLDTPILLTAIPEPWRHRLVVGAAADYFFGNRTAAAASALAIGAIPIERTRISRRSADQAAELINEGWSFLIYPEGGRSPDGWGQPFRGGAAYLALRCGVPVVPIHLQGTGQILPKGRRLPQFADVTVTFGGPLRPTDEEDSRRFATRIESVVAALADEATTDWWQARRRAHASGSPSLTGPEAMSWRRAWALGDRNRKRRRRQRRWPDLG